MKPNARLRIRLRHLKEVIEGPNADLIRIILAIRENRGRMPEDLAREIGCKDAATIQKIERAVMMPLRYLPPLQAAPGEVR